MKLWVYDTGGDDIGREIVVVRAMTFDQAYAIVCKGGWSAPLYLLELPTDGPVGVLVTKRQPWSENDPRRRENRIPR